jgi:hypothetical protein
MPMEVNRLPDWGKDRNRRDMSWPLPAPGEPSAAKKESLFMHSMPRMNNRNFQLSPQKAQTMQRNSKIKWLFPMLAASLESEANKLVKKAWRVRRLLLEPSE